jgi:putative aminopeptidase FrvX
VRAIDELGYIWLANGQGWQRNARVCATGFTIGQHVKILARHEVVPGIIAAATGHLAALSLPEPMELNWNDFWVDTGLSRQELMALGVTPGTRVIWDAETVQLGRHVVGKALDDRVLLAVITEVLRRVPVSRTRLRPDAGLLGAGGDRRGRRQRPGRTQ